MKLQVLHTVWGYVSGQAAGKLKLITLGSKRVNVSHSFPSDFRAVYPGISQAAPTAGSSRQDPEEVVIAIIQALGKGF